MLTLPQSSPNAIEGLLDRRPISTAYPLASHIHSGSRKTTPVQITPTLSIGGDKVVMIAGPCSIESEAMAQECASTLAKMGIDMLRGGAYKPRTSPYDFQGLGRNGIEILESVRSSTNIPVVTEVMDVRLVNDVAQKVDMIQVGARNMQNYPLLMELGLCGKPVLLKRGHSARIQELILAAEYIMKHGNNSVVLCERGIRTFENATRNTLDVSAIPVLKAETHLPVIVDPSHAAGNNSYVTPLANAAIAAGADGLIVEVHPDPASALSDADQQLNYNEFSVLMRRIAMIAVACGRTVNWQL